MWMPAIRDGELGRTRPGPLGCVGTFYTGSSGGVINDAREARARRGDRDYYSGGITGAAGARVPG